MTNAVCPAGTACLSNKRDRYGPLAQRMSQPELRYRTDTSEVNMISGMLFIRRILWTIILFGACGCGPVPMPMLITGDWSRQDADIDGSIVTSTYTFRSDGSYTIEGIQIVSGAIPAPQYLWQCRSSMFESGSFVVEDNSIRFRLTVRRVSLSECLTSSTNMSSTVTSRADEVVPFSLNETMSQLRIGSRTYIRGRLTATSCSVGMARCSPSGEREVCNALGSDFVRQPCAAGEMCNAGSCETATAGGSFSRCVSPTTCPGSMARCDALFPGGSCTIRCTTPGACTNGATCVSQLNQCYKTCTNGGGQCGMTERCIPVDDTTRICFPACSERPAAGSPACNAGTVCDPYSNACRAMTELPMGANNGDPCANDDACKSGICITEISDTDRMPTGYLGGMCISFGRHPGNAAIQPDRPLPQSTCPAGSVAIPSESGSNEGDSAVCFKGCTTNSGCRAGYECDRLLFSGTMQPTTGICSPINCMAAPYATMTNAGCPAATVCRRRMVSGSTTVTGVCARPGT